MLFIDRQEESQRIRQFLDSSSGGLCCLYGRRRCGKTRLLRECINGRPDCVYYIADKSERPSQIARFLQEVSGRYPLFQAVSGNDWGQLLDFWSTATPSGSCLVLDEFPYLVEKDNALPSILQRLCEDLNANGHKIIICGSSQRMMQGFVLKASEPLYGRAREILPITPIPFPRTQDAFPAMPPFERLKAWAVWGGIPRYWELQAEEKDVWTAVRRNVTSPLGLLRNEPQFLLLDDLDDSAQAATVLAFIGGGAHRLSELAARMGRVATDMSRPIQRLTELGLIVKDTPFGADSQGKKSLYAIADPFLDFWYTFVWPNWSRDDFLETPDERAAFDTAFLPFLGIVWERLVRSTLRRRGLPVLGGIPRQCARWWGTGRNFRPMALDIVADSPDGTTLLVGEAKLSLSVQEAELEMEKLRQKAQQLPFAGAYKHIIYQLFVAQNPPSGALGLDWASARTL